MSSSVARVAREALLGPRAEPQPPDQDPAPKVGGGRPWRSLRHHGTGDLHFGHVQQRGPDRPAAAGPLWQIGTSMPTILACPRRRETGLPLLERIRAAVR